jgi:hypothetical protein
MQSIWLLRLPRPFFKSIALKKWPSISKLCVHSLLDLIMRSVSRQVRGTEKDMLETFTNGSNNHQVEVAPFSSFSITVLETLVTISICISLYTLQRQDIRYAVLLQSKDAGVCASHSISLQKTHEKP